MGEILNSPDLLNNPCKKGSGVGEEGGQLSRPRSQESVILKSRINVF